jgi:AcrR family transcriptional regulator
VNNSDPPATGLRERKKEATRAALSWAALRLAVERGLDNVRVEDIAAEAGVSPRTFNNYFPSKYEAICSRAVQRTEKLADYLRGRPENEPLWESIIAATVQQYRGEGGATRGTDKQWRAQVRLIFSSPELRAAAMRQTAEAELLIAQVIAERTGTDDRRDMYPRLVAAAITAATALATDMWLHADPPVLLADLIEQALRLFAAGLPVP